MARRTLKKCVWTSISVFFFQSPVPYELEDCEIYVAYVYEYNKGPSRNFAWYSFGGPGSPQFLYSGPQMSKFAVFRKNRRPAVRLVSDIGRIFLSALELFVAVS